MDNRSVLHDLSYLQGGRIHLSAEEWERIPANIRARCLRQVGNLRMHAHGNARLPHLLREVAQDAPSEEIVAAVRRLFPHDVNTVSMARRLVHYCNQHFRNNITFERLARPAAVNAANEGQAERRARARLLHELGRDEPEQGQDIFGDTSSESTDEAELLANIIPDAVLVVLDPERPTTADVFGHAESNFYAAAVRVGEEAETRTERVRVPPGARYNPRNSPPAVAALRNAFAGGGIAREVVVVPARKLGDNRLNH